MSVTQAEIDEATMIAKNAAYKLAYELGLELKYGGKVDCCKRKLKLLWLWANTLSCQTAIQSAEGIVEITNVSIGNTINVLVNGESITDGVQISPTDNETTAMQALATIINEQDSEYTATFNGDKSKGEVYITGPCDAKLLTVVTVGATVVVTDFTGGFCEDQSCLTETKLKSLIAKVRAMCTK